MLTVSLLERRDAAMRAAVTRRASSLDTARPPPAPFSNDPDASTLAADLLLSMMRERGIGAAGLRRAPDGRLLAMIPGSGVSVSVSHWGDLVAAAIDTRSTVGIDVQKRDARRLDDLVDAILCPREREEFEHRGRAAFFDAWTRREAALKVFGASVLTIREVETEDGINLTYRGRKLVAHDLPCPDDGYSLAVAVAAP